MFIEWLDDDAMFIIIFLCTIITLILAIIGLSIIRSFIKDTTAKMEYFVSREGKRERQEIEKANKTWVLIGDFNIWGFDEAMNKIFIIRTTTINRDIVDTLQNSYVSLIIESIKDNEK